MFFQIVRVALRQPGIVMENYKAFAHTAPKKMNSWLLFSSMFGAIYFGKAGVRWTCS